MFVCLPVYPSSLVTLDFARQVDNNDSENGDGDESDSNYDGDGIIVDLGLK